MLDRSYLSTDVRVWVLIATGDAILLADSVDFLDECNDWIKLFVRLTNCCLELFMAVDKTLKYRQVTIGNSHHGGKRQRELNVVYPTVGLQMYVKVI